jgi:hypothetical protein
MHCDLFTIHNHGVPCIITSLPAYNSANAFVFGKVVDDFCLTTITKKRVSDNPNFSL